MQHIKQILTNNTVLKHHIKTSLNECEHDCITLEQCITEINKTYFTHTHTNVYCAKEISILINRLNCKDKYFLLNELQLI